MSDDQPTPTRRTKIIKEQTMSDEEPTPRFTQRVSKKKVIIYSLAVVTVFSLALAGYSTWELYKIKNPAYQQKMVQDATNKIVSAVGSLMALPAGTPQIATVADAVTLKKTEAFFANAENGDQVLVYTDKAILYRPSTNKIINVGPVTRDQTPTTPASTGSQTTNSTPATTSNPNKKTKN